MRYTCESFGWYGELVEQTQACDLAAAEATLNGMLDAGAMIVHVYRTGDPDNPELVGRHSRLRLFNAATRSGSPPPHEIERFLLDPAGLDRWTTALNTGEVLEEHWSVVEMWAASASAEPCIYGKARLIA